MKIVVASLGDRWSNAMAYGLQKNGHEVRLLEIYKRHCVDEVIADLKSLEPFDFMILRNFHFIAIDGAISEAYDYLFTECPYKIVVWYHDSQAFQDEPRIQTLWSRHKKLKNSILFSIDAEDIPLLQQNGNSAFHLPICADGLVLRHRESSEWKSTCQKFAFDISFAGNQIYKEPPFPREISDFREAFEERLFEKIEDRLRYRDSWPDIKSQISNLFLKDFKDGYEFGNFLELAEKAFAEPDQQVWRQLYPEINSWYSWYQLSKRLWSLRNSWDLRVFGCDEWKYFLAGYPFETRSLSELELHALFATSKISYCFTKFHFKTAVHERPFLISASGGFALTENRKDLRLSFAEDEMATYSCEEDLAEKINYYLRHDSERLAMAEKACQRTRREHLYEHRMQEMIAILRREHFI